MCDEEGRQRLLAISRRGRLHWIDGGCVGKLSERGPEGDAATTAIANALMWVPGPVIAVIAWRIVEEGVASLKC